jgi:hypothetical protein
MGVHKPAGNACIVLNMNINARDHISRDTCKSFCCDCVDGIVSVHFQVCAPLNCFGTVFINETLQQDVRGHYIQGSEYSQPFQNDLVSKKFLLHIHLILYI